MIKSQFRYISSCLACIIVAIFVSTAVAQEFRGTISGTVTDPNGAVVPGASVTVKNTQTNASNTVTSSDDGAYTVPFLVPGSYTITATASGFKTSTIENVSVKVDDRLKVDLALQVGTAAEVNIVGNAEVLEQGSVSVGTLVSQRQIEELPLAEGAPYTLATQAPGIVYTGDPNFQGPTANGNLAGFRSNGTQGNQVNGTGGNVVNLDGSPNLAYDGQVAFTPPSEATQEFKVQTNTFDAQMGFTAGAILNVATKSGTNKFHGAAYWYNRDKSRTANNFFNNRAGLDRPERKYNRYGFTINGPLPFFNFGEGGPFFTSGKDKTFFMFAYERQKDNVAQTTTYSVPTKLMRQGNFSELPYPIYNPYTAFNGNSTCSGAGTNRVCRAPFAGNIITPSLIYAPALAFMKYFPEPNLPGVQNNYITDQNLNRPYRSYLFRVDHNVNDATRVFAKFYHSRNTEDRYNLTMQPDSIFRGFENRRNLGGNVGVTSTLSPKFILDVRGSWGMFKLKRFQVDQPTVADLGFLGIPADRQNHIFPRFDFTNWMTVGSNRADYNDGRERPFDMFTLQPTLTQIWGNHTLRYGYDFRNLHETFDYAGNAAGRFTFQGTYTMPNSSSGNTERDLPGRDLASFLMGIPASGSIDNPQVYDVSSNYHGLFIQDDWRATSKLTLNLGLRYELESGFKESQGRMAIDFNRTAASPIQAQVLANFNASPPPGVPITSFQNLAGGFIFANDSSTPNQKTDKNNWQPRIGASYALNDKTVIRGGFGIFTAPFQIITQNAVFQPGFSTPTAFPASTNNGLTFPADLRNAFPSGILPSVGSAQGLMTFVGTDLTAVGNNGPTTVILQNDRQNANYMRFIVGVQRELWNGISVEATYVYSHGKNLEVNRELNYISRDCRRSDNGNPCLIDLATANPATLLADITSTTTYLGATISNPFRGLVPSSTAWNGQNIARRRLLTPFPQFGNVSVAEYNGTSNFHSIQLQFVKRFTKGLSLNGSYTWSREHLQNQYLNPQDTELTDYISPNERPHRITFTGIYELPFGKGRSFGSDWNSVVDAFLGGWQVQGLYEWQKGEPLLFPNVYYNGDPSQLKSMLGKKDEQGRRYGIDLPAWDLSGFYLNGVQSNANLPAVGQSNYNSGTEISLRNFPLTLDNLRNQRFLKFDVGLSKNFRIREGMKFQIRIEAINALNNPYFSSPETRPNQFPTTANGATNTLGTFGFTNAPVRQPPRDIQIGGRFTF